jgi:lipopolysaccharide export LptBFGC system permease protein LptF
MDGVAGCASEQQFPAESHEHEKSKSGGPMRINLREWANLYNYAEVAIWPSIGVVLGLYSVRQRGAAKRDCLIAAVVLFVFGVSDWFEANTNNEWWHPWWLLLWKASCVAILFALLFVAWRRRKREMASAKAGASEVR